jgi:ankyrin repeat protein
MASRRPASAVARVTTGAVLVATMAACVGTGRSEPSGSAATTARGGNVMNERLFSAAASGDVAGISAALVGGADVDARDAHGRTALLVATIAGQVDAVRRLLDAEPDVDLQDDQLDNPFLYAGAEGLTEILRLVNEAGADPSLTNRFGGTALIPASERGHVETVRYLLEETDVDIDHVNRLGWTALLEAIVLGNGDAAHQKVVRLLIEHGADVDIADKDGVRPLAHARAKGQTVIAAALEAAGAQN